MSRGFRSGPASLRAGCVLQHGQGDPGISINGSRCYCYYWDTDAVLQTCEHYHQNLLPPRAKDRPLFHRPGSVHQPTHCSHTVAGLQYRGQKTSTVFNTAIPNWHAVRQDACSTVPRILGHAMPTQAHKGAEKGAEEKNRPRLRPIMENFTFPRPTGIHSAAQGYRAQSAQSRSQSGIPDGAAP